MSETIQILNKAAALNYLKNLQLPSIIEANIFNHPAFLHAAMTQFAGDNCGLIKVQNNQSFFLLPFQVCRAGLGLKKTICGWSNIYATQGTPIVSAATTEKDLADILKALSSDKHRLPDTLLLPDTSLDAPFAGMLYAAAEHNHLPVRIIRQSQRPVLQTELDAQAYLTQAIGKNHRREYRRLWRRLSETGQLDYRVISQTTLVFQAFENFLSLEAAGWKAQCGTAFLSKPQDSEFARQAIRTMAQHNLVHIHELSLNGRVIAGLVVFIWGDQAWTWKTAYDESLKAYSPGVLLMIEVLQNHLENPALRITDSCAVPDHPVMSRLFHERALFGTIILGLTPNSQRAVNTIARQLQRYDRLRALARDMKARISR